MKRDKIKISVFILCMLLLPLSLCFGGDERTVPADICIIFDNSASMKNNSAEALAWINEHVLDNILQSGDTLTIWSVADRSVMEFSGPVGGPEKLNEIRKILASLSPKENAAGNYRTAFEEIQRKRSSVSPQILTYTILVTGISDKTTSLSGAESASILKYSRSKDFPGWKVMIIGLGLESKVKSAAAAYINSQL